MEMTIEEWAKDFKSYVNELQMPRDDYKGIMGYIDDALALLKEQEAVEPTMIHEGRNKYYNNYVCPRCDNDVVYEQNYCSECGVKFMWESR